MPNLFGSFTFGSPVELKVSYSEDSKALTGMFRYLAERSPSLFLGGGLRVGEVGENGGIFPICHVGAYGADLECDFVPDLEVVFWGEDGRLVSGKAAVNDHVVAFLLASASLMGVWVDEYAVKLNSDNTLSIWFSEVAYPLY